MIDTQDKIGFFGRSSWPRLKLTKDWKYLTVNLFEFTRFRIWLNIDKYKNKKLHFCLILFGVFFSVDTACKGKKLFGRLNLTYLFGKDYRIYSQTECVVESENQ